MKIKVNPIIGILGAAFMLASAQVPPCIPRDAKIEAKVEAKLQKMTLDEKVGQMCELTIESVTDYDATGRSGEFTFSKALDEVIGTYKIGSILNTPMGVAQKRTVKLTVKASDLAFVGADLKWVLEKGDFLVKCGTEKLTLTCTETYRWDTPNKD